MRDLPRKTLRMWRWGRNEDGNMVRAHTQKDESLGKTRSEEDQRDHASDQKGFDSWCDECQKKERRVLSFWALVVGSWTSPHV